MIGEGKTILRERSSRRALPAVLLLSVDRRLHDLVTRAAAGSYVVRCDVPHAARAAVERLLPTLVVVDDAGLDEAERGWFLEQVHRLVPGAFVVYVAERQDAELERSVRARGVTYYTSRPLDAVLLGRVLGSLVGRADGFVVRARAS